MISLIYTPDLLTAHTRFALQVNRSIHGLVVVLLLCGFSSFAETNASLALRYARLYERELLGEQSGLVQDYRALYASARGVDTELAEKSLYRIGVCEKKLGRMAQARAAWRELADTFPLNDPVVSTARDLLKALEWEMDKVLISGVVRVPAVEAGGLPAGRSIVFAGEWGNEPPVLTGVDGAFNIGRRAAGSLPDGRSYGLIYVEHATSSLIGADVWIGSSTTGLTVSLSVPVTLVGWVVDRSGSPVAGARIRVTGFKMVAAASSASRYPVPLPVDRLIPPIYSGTNGTFVAERLPAGLRYELAPEKPDYRVVLKSDVIGFQGANSVITGYANNLSTQQLSNLYENITWLRGNLAMGAPFRWDEFRGRVVVFHFGSVYGEASLRSQYPDEGGVLSRLVELYGGRGCLCLWVLPEGEGKGEAAQMALGLYPDLPVGVMGEESREMSVEKQESGKWDWARVSGNVVVGRDGRIQAVCSDQQVFKAAKKALEEFF
ncbi:MAG: hypothetical protein WCI03_01530 [bacterium]|jgi:hypothetical protein